MGVNSGGLSADRYSTCKDVVASGTIQRITPDNALRNRIAGADERSWAPIYAEQGIWYDTIDALTRMIDSTAIGKTCSRLSTSLSLAKSRRGQ
jgi:hypothetical protein